MKKIKKIDLLERHIRQNACVNGQSDFEATKAVSGTLHSKLAYAVENEGNGHLNWFVRAAQAHNPVPVEYLQAKIPAPQGKAWGFTPDGDVTLYTIGVCNCGNENCPYNYEDDVWDTLGRTASIKLLRIFVQYEGK